MRQYPDCLNKRYQALDELIRELGEVTSEHSREVASTDLAPTDPGIKLMVKFWNILKEDPDCNLPRVVQQRMEMSERGSGFVTQDISCYATSQDGRGQDPPDKIKVSAASATGSKSPQTPHSKEGSCTKTGDTSAPLTKVLCNLNEAASFDKKCSARISELKAIQKKVSEQVAELEAREKEGTKKMKEADCMWSCMEDAYKQKIAESIERQKQLMKEQLEIDSHVAKWRKSKKELEAQMKQLEKCEKDIKEKFNRKTNDLKCIKAEIADLKKRIDVNAKDIEAAKNSVSGKKKASAAQIEKITEDLKRIQEKIDNEHKLKQQKEEEGHQYIKDARDDLQNICRILLQKRLENEDLKVEIDAIIDEIELLKKTTDQCKDKCKNKQDSLTNALKQINNEIASFQVRCTRCHACVDTQDNRRFCTDCIKCQEQRECIYNEGQCVEDPANDCICMSIKKKFLDNVFENMYTVLERNSKTGAGKALADQILASLKNSRNGKLNEPTKRALQEFVLVTVKKNLNLTIIGGAVKTRCEMDPETYSQLMNCLNKMTVTPPEKKDVAIPAKKEACNRWGGTGECNCPSGPKYCICSRKAPPPPHDPTPCPQLEEDKDDIGNTPACPYKEDLTCGPDCGNVETSDTVKQLVKNFNPSTCSGQSCTFSKNMRAAQCMLGQDSLNTISNTKGYMTSTPIVPNLSTKGHMAGTPVLPDPDKYKERLTKPPFVSDIDEQMSCSCGCGSEKPCSCINDVTRNPRNNIIDEVMGRYTEVSPIEKLPKRNNKKPYCKCCQTSGRNSKQTKCVENMTGNRKEHKGTRSKKYIRKKEEYNNLRVSVTDHRRKENAEKFTQKEKILFPKAVTTEVEQDKDGNDEINVELSKDNEIPLVEAEVLSKAYQDCGTEPYISISRKSQQRNYFQEQVNDLTEETPPKDLFKIAVPNDNGVIDQEFTELIATSSGTIQMALDEKIIADIDEKTKENPNLNVALRKTISGHFILEFKKCDCHSSESRRVVVRRTETGSIIMEVHKDLIDIVQPSVLKCTDKSMPNRSFGLKKQKKMHNKPNIGINEKEVPPAANTANIKDKSDESKESSRSGNSPSISIDKNDWFTSRIAEKKGYHDIPRYLRLNDSKNRHKDDTEQERVLIKVVSNCTNTNATDLIRLRRCLRKMDKDLKKAENKEEMDAPGKSLPITKIEQFLALKDDFQKRINSNRTSIYIKVLGENGIESDVRAQLTKTPSGQIAVDAEEIIKEGKIASRLKEYPITFVRRNSKYVLKFGEHDTKTNAILRRSSSGAAHVVLRDPTCKLHINNQHTLKDKKGFFRVKVKGVSQSDLIPTSVMRITNSGNYVFVLDKEFENLYTQTIKDCVGDDHECFVGLSKTQSDCFVIDFDRKSDSANTALLVKSNSGNIKLLVRGPTFEAIHTSLESVNRSSIVFEELFKKLPHSSRELHRENLAKSKYLVTKSFSDSRLCDKMRFQGQNRLLEMPSAVLKRTASGNYAVVLNKEFKPSFINNLKNYISSTGQGFVPIVKTDQGDIIISSNRDHKGLYGTVKITPSGNIYVSVDENVVKQIGNDAISRSDEKTLSEQSSQSVHMIGTIMHSLNKAVTTTSHSKQNSNDCDASKHLQSVESSWTYTPANENARDQRFACNQLQVEKRFTMMPYSILKRQTKTDKQYYFIIDTNNKNSENTSESSVEQANKPRKGTDNAQSDQIEKEPVRDNNCYCQQEHPDANVHQKPDLSYLDYFESLPPQLPPFLREY